MANLGVNQDNKLKIGKIGGIPRLVRLAASPTLQVKVEAIAALGNLAVNDFNELEIVKDGALPHLSAGAAVAAQYVQFSLCVSICVCPSVCVSCTITLTLHSTSTGTCSRCGGGVLERVRNGRSWLRSVQGTYM